MTSREPEETIIQAVLSHFCGEMSEFVGGLLRLVRFKSGPLNLLGSAVTFDRQFM